MQKNITYCKLSTNKRLMELIGSTTLEPSGYDDNMNRITLFNTYNEFIRSYYINTNYKLACYNRSFVVLSSDLDIKCFDTEGYYYEFTKSYSSVITGISDDDIIFIEDRTSRPYKTEKIHLS